MFELLPFVGTPSPLLGTKIELADGNECDRQPSPLKVWLVSSREGTSFHQIGDDVRIEDYVLCVHEFA